jgi:preprotein translocase subunit SecB
MNPSPITFVSFKFLRVHIEVDFDAQTNPGEDFDFGGAMLAWSLNHGRHDDGTWWVAVGFATPSTDENPRCPYHIDMQAVGVFRVSDPIDEARREEIVFENGAALVYGSIRDMVSTVTARSISGPLMLPTPSFVGEFKTHQQKLAKKK